MADPLFRLQVSDKDRKRWLGEILLAQPVSGAFFAVFSLLVLLGLAGALYLVKVALKTQNAMAYGKAAELQDGMQVEADVLIDTRKLYEWVLEPLYSLTGKL